MSGDGGSWAKPTRWRSEAEDRWVENRNQDGKWDDYITPCEALEDGE